MNILLFVISMLMLMTLMTYSRIESYRGFAIMQSQFEFYMQSLEREDFDQGAKKCYNSHFATQKEKNEDNTEKRAPGSSKLNFKIFVDKKERDKNEQAYQQFFLVAKNLINTLYGHTKFLTEALEKDPNIVDQLLTSIGEESAKMKKKEAVTNLCDLARINLQDEDLQLLFYNMLEGGVEIPEEEKGTVKTQKSYPKLSDYLIMQNKAQIRVYLAPKPLLIAVFGDPTIADDIIKRRKELFARVDDKDNPLPAGEATQLFKDEFEGQRLNTILSTLLDFTVSKTKPGG